jgi:CDP-diacylglycerol pyrophosphatase
LFAAIDCLTRSSPEHLCLSLFFHNRDRPFNPAMSSISEGFVLRKVTSFAATMGLILATLANLPHSASAANRGGLWAVVHDICVPAYQSIGVGFPCSEVSIAAGLERGFAVLRAPSSATHVIVVPTARISGIESPELLRENAPNYWEAACDARRFVEKGARRQLPRDKIGMAINSAASRSQDQLHIHVARIAPKVAEFLRRHQAEIHEAWSFLSAALLGHRIAAMKVETDSLAHVDPSVGQVFHGKPNAGCESDVRWWQDRSLSFGQRVWCIAEENRKCGSRPLDDKCAN